MQVHCDPHAANMLVRAKNGKPELILLDHGLYRQITDDFRLEYAGERAFSQPWFCPEVTKRPQLLTYLCPLQ